jgi:hypothetical protein
MASGNAVAVAKMKRSSTVLSSHGTGGVPAGKFTYDGLSARITKIEVTASAPQNEVSHLGIPAGERKMVTAAPLSDSPEVKVDFIGNSLPPVGTKKAFTLVGRFEATKADICSMAVCTAANVKATVGELIKGTATFKLSKA